VAVGDSFTEGLDDPYPGGSGYRGWADLVAGQLAAGSTAGGGLAGGPGLGYANLAVRGRLFDSVVAEQVVPALAMRPDLVSFAAGGNDVLRRRFDPPALVARFDAVVGEVRAAGADVILFRFADVSKRLPGRRVVRPRVDLLNAAVFETAQRHGAFLVDLWADDEFANPMLFSLDRLHLSPAGHRRVAAHVLAALGVTPQPDWLTAPPLPPPAPWLAARRADLRWAGDHLAPWVRRRLTGRSSGDAVTAKRPSLAPFTE
jgi:lysophospholipase L1-like esterase